VAPGTATSIPSNQPVLVVRAASANTGPPIEPQAGSNLRLESAGVPVPFTVAKHGASLYWFVTPERLIAGASYTLSYAYDCGAGPRTETSTFSVVPPVAPPMTAGTLKAEMSGVTGTDKTNSAGDCSINYRYAFAYFSLVPSAELIPYLGVSRVVAQVDGNFWSEIGYGQSSEIALPYILLMAACKPGTVPGAPNLAPGKHVLKVSVEVASGPSFTLPEQEVLLSCSEDGGADGGTPAPPGADGSTPDAGGPTLTGGADGCDCALGGRTHGLAPAGLVALVALAMVCRRRSRARTGIRTSVNTCPYRGRLGGEVVRHCPQF
jgi:hypothetical protein